MAVIGPVSTKVTAATIGSAVASVLWAVLSRTVFRDLSAEELTLYAGNTAVVLTAVFGALVPESGEFANHAKTKAESGTPSASASDALGARLDDLEKLVRELADQSLGAG
jgi:hypothetical protein